MKISELIELLQYEMSKYGDNEVFINYNSEISKIESLQDEDGYTWTVIVDECQ